MSDLQRIEEKLDAVAKDIVEIKVMDATQNAQLAEHIRRTNMLESRLDSIWPRALIVLSILGGIITLARSLL